MLMTLSAKVSSKLVHTLSAIHTHSHVPSKSALVVTCMTAFQFWGELGFFCCRGESAVGLVYVCASWGETYDGARSGIFSRLRGESGEGGDGQSSLRRDCGGEGGDGGDGGDDGNGNGGGDLHANYQMICGGILIEVGSGVKRTSCGSTAWFTCVIYVFKDIQCVSSTAKEGREKRDETLAAEPTTLTARPTTGQEKLARTKMQS